MAVQTVEPHAFISYVREDAAETDRVQSFLEAAGVAVWRDTARLWPGDDWRAKIREAITEDSLVFIACFSARSSARATTYQNEELRMAIDQLRQRRPDQLWLIPVRFSNCRIPDFDLGAGQTLDSLQRVDLFGGEWDVGLARLLVAVQRILHGHSGHSGQSAPPPLIDPSAIHGEPDELSGTTSRLRLPSLVLGGPLDNFRPSNARTPAGQTTDLTLRCGVVLPACVNGPSNSEDVVSRVTGDPREKAIAEVLGSSELTTWFSDQRAGFNLAAIPDWSPRGHNARDHSQLVIQPNDDSDQPGPLAGLCQVQTGWVNVAGTPDDLRPGLRVIIELSLRILEYDADRRPSQTRHATTPPPAPAAISVTQLFESVVAILSTSQVAGELWYPLLEDEDPGSGLLVCWLTTDGATLDRLVDLSVFRAIPESGSGSYGMVRRSLPFEASPTASAVQARRDAAHELLAGVLEQAGRRGYDDVLAALSQGLS